MLALILLMAPTCGGSDDGFSGGGTSTGTPPTDDTGSSTGGDDTGDDDGGGNNSDDLWLDASVTCEGDRNEYTWVYSASLSKGASTMYVEVDAGHSDWEKWDLNATDDARKEWREEVTELLSSRPCTEEGLVDFYAFIGANHETIQVEYTP